MIPFQGMREFPSGSFRKATLSHKTSGSSLFLQIQPSPVEMEHVSTTTDIAKSGPLENGSPLLDTTSFDLTSYQVY